jgi:hypothetical protein
MEIERMAKNKDTPGRPTARRTWAQSAIAEGIRALGAASHQHVRATHVIAYLPPFILGTRKARREFPDGMWDLQKVADFAAGEPPMGGDWSLDAPRNTDQAELAAWATEMLGHPVLLEEASTEIRLSRRLSRWREIPLYYARPAA